jgi:hypothetical protein
MILYRYILLHFSYSTSSSLRFLFKVQYRTLAVLPVFPDRERVMRIGVLGLAEPSLT